MLKACCCLLSKLPVSRNLIQPKIPSHGNNLASVVTSRFLSNNVEPAQTGDQGKKRPGKKRKTVDEVAKRPGYFNLVAFSTGEEYDLEQLETEFCKNEMLEVSNFGSELPHTDFLHAEIRNDKKCSDGEKQEVYVFREGAVVTWNVRDIDIEVLLGLVSKHQSGAFNEDIVREEFEVMNYTYARCPGQTSKICDDDIALEKGGDSKFDKFAISNATALSVKLGTWEATLAKYIDSMESVTDDMKQGRKISMSQNEVMRRTGELFSLRHAINLNSDLLDTPDAYWDQEDLEKVYTQTIAYFCVNKRTRVINEKLNHCVELVDLLSSHLRDRHHIRLEWMIIILILIEVVFELNHFLENLEKNQEEKSPPLEKSPPPPAPGED